MWKAITIAVFLWITAIVGETPQNAISAADTTSNVWYTQIGTWHLIHDSLSGTSHLYHNAAIDGATSGQARADLKLNRRIRGLTHLSAIFSPGRASVAGVVLKDKMLTYGIYLEKGTGIDSVRIIRRFKKQQTGISAFSIVAADSQHLDVTISANSLIVRVGNIVRNIKKPADLPMEVIIALSCLRGDVRVVGIRIDAASAHINESFAEATIINLGMERMFPAGQKKGR